MSATPVSLTIVITTYNRKRVLEELLESLSSQEDKEFEVVVANDGSSDGTDEMLASIRTPFPLRSVNTHCEGYGLAVARNLGILEARTDLVAIIDDDCFPETGFVAAHKRSARRKTITGGPRTPALATDTLQHAKMLELARLPPCEPIGFDRLRREWPKAVATECNICMYRDDFLALGLFSERLKIYGFSGQEFFARADHDGFCYQFNPDAAIVHRRQAVGDNGLSRWRRKWQIMLAVAIRPSLMNPPQYEVQRRWAKCKANAYPQTCELPRLPKSAFVTTPFRFLRNRAGDVRRRLRKAALAR